MRGLAQTWFLPVVTLGVVIAIPYIHLMNSFYEQEEWLGLGNVFVYGRGYLLLAFDQGFYKVLLGENRILSSLITYFFYAAFPFNSLPITIFALVIHLFNSFLVYYLVKRSINDKWSALIGAIFFSVNATSQSAVSWGAAVSTLPASTALLLSLLFFLKSINYFYKGVIRYKLLTISLAILYLSLLFKQIGIFLIPVYLITVVLYSSGRENAKNYMAVFLKKYFMPVLLFVVTIVVYLMKYVSNNAPDALFLTGASQHFFESLLLRIFLYPLTSLSQLFIPPEHFLNFARYITNIFYPFFPAEHFILIAQTVVLDLLSVISSVLILVTVFFLCKGSKESDKYKVWFFVLFTFSTFLPYALISKSFSYLDSRYYYPGVIGASFILAWILNRISVVLKIRLLATLLVLALVILHANTIKVSNEKQAIINIERKMFLQQLSEIKPQLQGDKNVIYISGNGDFYLPGHKVPFQNGMGHTLLVWYYQSGNVPRELIKSKQLFEIGSQGYFEFGDVGFGYFSDEETLRRSLIKYNLSESVVTRLYYDARNKSLTNVTGKIEEYGY